MLEETLGREAVNELGRQTGQSQRLRVITPFRLSVSLLAELGAATAESIADLLRAFNFHHGEKTAYKAFYNRLAHPGFPTFMRALLERMLAHMTVRVLKPVPGSPLEQFDDILIQDGSSFAVKASLKHVFPGRFKTSDPAAVELHATLSAFRDEVVRVQVAPDKVQERAFLPAPAEVAGSLLLADRGYPSFAYFQDLTAAGGSWLMRMSRGNKPYVVASHRRAGTEVFAEPVPLQQFLTMARGQEHDLDVELRKGRDRLRCRLVVRPTRSGRGLWLCTNLPRDRFSDDLIVRLYGFRWQVELLFKEWKSYANLRKFDTGNPAIAEGLIWASLAAAVLKRFIAHAAESVMGIAISTRKVAMCAHLFLVRILKALGQRRRLVEALGATMSFLGREGARASPRVDRATGRLGVGLEVIHAA